MNENILVVDNDENIQDSIAKVLKQDRYNLKTVANGQDAIDILESGEIDVILLEIELPGMNGIEVVKRAKEISPDTLAIIHAKAPTIDSAIQAVKHQAHDYLQKPCGQEELLSSIARAIARRNERTRKRQLLDQFENIVQQFRDIEGFAELPKHERLIAALPNDVSGDFSRRVIWRGTDREKLTPTENKLLEIFVENWGRVIKHTELVFMLQGYEINEIEAPEILRPLVSRLRKKLASFPQGKNWISSVRGVGYVFDANKI